MHKQEGEIQQSLPITDHTYVMKATYGKDETNSVVSIQSANAQCNFESIKTISEEELP